MSRLLELGVAVPLGVAHRAVRRSDTRTQCCCFQLSASPCLSIPPPWHRLPQGRSSPDAMAGPPFLTLAHLATFYTVLFSAAQALLRQLESAAAQDYATRASRHAQGTSTDDGRPSTHQQHLPEDGVSTLAHSPGRRRRTAQGRAVARQPVHRSPPACSYDVQHAHEGSIRSGRRRDTVPNHR